ncbi:hypothetical protein ABIA38_004807 [Embleya sp. AB8]
MDSEWEILLVDEVRDWIEGLDDLAHARVVQVLDARAEGARDSGGRWSTPFMARRWRI